MTTLTLTPLIHSFEGEPLLSFSWGGMPCWVARHIGARLGYGDGGKRLPTKIVKEWANEFIYDIDYAVLEGEQLAEFHRGLDAAGVDRIGRGSLCVLFETGIHLVLAKTELPIGRRLRRFLVDHVLPQIARTGRYEASASRVTTEGLLAKKPMVQSLAVRREARLLLQARVRARYVDLCDRRLRVTTLHYMLDALGGLIETEARIAVEVIAAEIATGLRIAGIVAPGPDAPPAANAAINTPVAS